MRDVKGPGSRRFNLWWLLPLVLLALPNCFLNAEGCIIGETCPVEEEPTCPDPENPECPEPPPDDVFFPGTDPDDAIFCDIPKPPNEDDDPCASQTEADDPDNISLAEAATALVEGNYKSFALDFSDPIACAGQPKKIRYFGEFPEGLRVCINCGTQIPDPHASMLNACIAKCQDLINQGGNIPAEGTQNFCLANVKLSTNHDPDICYGGACIGGNPNMNWDDPRKSPELVTWIDEIDTSDDGGTNSLHRTSATSGTTTADFNAGAASAQTIKGGDAWVEFEAGDATDTVHVLGLRTSVDGAGDPCVDPVNCPDTDPHIETVGFAIDLNSDGNVYVLEPNPDPAILFDVYGPFGPYLLGERYRIRVKDNLDGTASISYHRVGATGIEAPAFATNTSADPSYPLRVDTTFRELNAKVSDVTIVRIK